MKLINITCVVVGILVGAATWKYITPIISKNGTSVISANVPKQVGGAAVSIKVPELTEKQYDLLNFAYKVAKHDGIADPKYLQGVLMQESKAGQMNYRVSGLSNPTSDRYFGVGQIKLVAAKFVMEKFPAMWGYLDTNTDEELQAKLILDDYFNIRVASKYLLLMGINLNPSKAITAYNKGPGGAATVDPSQHAYTIKAKQYGNKVKSLLTGTIARN